MAEIEMSDNGFAQIRLNKVLPPGLIKMVATFKFMYQIFKFSVPFNLLRKKT
jgi:hypothetical protein